MATPQELIQQLGSLGGGLSSAGLSGDSLQLTGGGLQLGGADLLQQPLSQLGGGLGGLAGVLASLGGGGGGGDGAGSGGGSGPASQQAAAAAALLGLSQQLQRGAPAAESALAAVQAGVQAAQARLLLNGALLSGLSQVQGAADAEATVARQMSPPPASPVQAEQPAPKEPGESVKALLAQYVPVETERHAAGAEPKGKAVPRAAASSFGVTSSKAAGGPPRPDAPPSLAASTSKAPPPAPPENPAVKQLALAPSLLDGLPGLQVAPLEKLNLTLSPLALDALPSKASTPSPGVAVLPLGLPLGGAAPPAAVAAWTAGVGAGGAVPSTAAALPPSLANATCKALSSAAPPERLQQGPLAVVLERLGANAIVKTPFGRGVMKALKHYKGVHHAVIELCARGTLSVPAERAAEYEVVGKMPQPVVGPPKAVAQRAPDPPGAGAAAGRRGGGGGAGGPRGGLRAWAHEDNSPGRGGGGGGGVRAERRCDAPGGAGAPAAASPGGAPAGTPAAGDDERVAGEWRHVENILSISTGEDGLLTITADSTHDPLILHRRGKVEDDHWHARRRGSDETIYDVRLSGRDTLLMRKGDHTFSVHRVARSRTVAGEWETMGKSLRVFTEESAAGRPLLTLATDGKDPLRLVRRRITEWEAVRESTGESVYVVGHSEGSDKISIRPAEAGNNAEGTVEFTRSSRGLPEAKPSPAASSVKVDDRAGSSTRPAPKGASEALPAKQPEAPAAETGSVDDFIRANGLAPRTATALRAASSKEQKKVMGLNGGKNGFVLLGRVRDPDAVVMSRLKNLESKSQTARSRSRSRSSSRQQRGRSGSRSRSRSRARRRREYSPDGGGRRRRGAARRPGRRGPRRRSRRRGGGRSRRRGESRGGGRRKDRRAADARRRSRRDGGGRRRGRGARKAASSSSSSSSSASPSERAPRSGGGGDSSEADGSGSSSASAGDGAGGGGGGGGRRSRSRSGGGRERPPQQAQAALLPRAAAAQQAMPGLVAGFPPQLPAAAMPGAIPPGPWMGMALPPQMHLGAVVPPMPPMMMAGSELSTAVPVPVPMTAPGGVCAPALAPGAGGATVGGSRGDPAELSWLKQEESTKSAVSAVNGGIDDYDEL